MRAVLASIRCQIFKVGRFNDKPVTETDRKGDCQTAATGQPNRSGENQLKPVADGWRKPIQLEAVLKVKQQQKKKKKA